MDSGSLCVCMCTKVLKGTGVDPPPVVPLLELPLPPEAAVREFDALAFCDAADTPADPDNTRALPAPIEAEESAEVELVPEIELVVLLARFSTPDELELSDEPLLLEVGVRRALPEAAAPPEPAPEDEPAVFEATAVGVPLRAAWMYRSCRLPGLRWNLGSASRIT